MKILHVCETAIGGVASYLNMICNIDPKVENIILAPEQHVKGIDPTLDIRSYPAKGRSARTVWIMLNRTRRLIREEQPDIVFFQSSFSLLAMTAMRMLGDRRPFIYCAHGWSASIYPEGSIKQYIIRIIEGTLCGLADRVVNISSTDRKLAEESGYLGHHVLIENAVIDRTENVRNDLFGSSNTMGGRERQTKEALHLLFIGRFDRQKGLDILLPAFVEARSRVPNLRLHIVGGPVRNDGAAIDLPENVSRAGWVDKTDIDNWYASADALIVPSRWEGFGLVVPEALRNGTPVLVSKRGALPSLVVPGETGEIFELEKESIVRCLTSLDKADLQRRHSACRALYESRFTFERLARNIHALYLDVLGVADK